MSSVKHTNNTSREGLPSKLLLFLLLSLFIITASYAERSYGPVKKNDYLSKIVRKEYANTSLTHNQIMVAILRANPDDFKGGNIHFLKQGATLVLPDDESIASIPNAEATELIAKHLVYAKQGKTGHFNNKPLDITTTSEKTQEQGQPVTPPATNQPTDASYSANTKATNTQPSNAGAGEIPSKIKIEIRKEIGEKENKYKHVTELEKISSQQNKMLKTLDEQIELLEQQISTNNPHETSDKNEPDDNKSLKETKETQDTGKDQSGLNNNNSQNNNEADKSLLKSGQESAIAEPEGATDTATDKESSLFVKEKAGIQTDNTITANVADDKITQTGHIAPPTPVTDTSKEVDTSSFSDYIQSINKAVLYSILGVLGLGLFALGYFLTSRSTVSGTITEKVTSTSFRNTTFVETPGKPYSIPDQESLQSPVLTEKNDDNSKITMSGSSDEKTADDIPDDITQEAELKINMARAYMDVGYIDAAKEVLEEVLEEGNQEQKETVKQMISMI